MPSAQPSWPIRRRLGTPLFPVLQPRPLSRRKRHTHKDDPALHFHDNPGLTYFHPSSHPFSPSPPLPQTYHPTPNPCPLLPDTGFVSLIEANSRLIMKDPTFDLKLLLHNILIDEVLMTRSPLSRITKHMRQ